MTKRLVISYPVVFDNSPICELRLPKDLRRQEAERVKLMVDALVIRDSLEPAPAKDGGSHRKETEPSVTSQ